MSKPRQRAKTSFATPDDLFARYDRRAIEFLASDVRGRFQVPDVPEDIQSIPDALLRQRATEVWKAAQGLVKALDAWHAWFRELRETGDEQPGIAIICDEHARHCVRALCDAGVNAPPFDKLDKESILAMLPPVPSWSMAGTDLDFDTETGELIETPMVRWQDDPEFRASYWGGPSGRCSTSTRLRGMAWQLCGCLGKFPASVLVQRSQISEPGSPPAAICENVSNVVPLDAEDLRVLRALETATGLKTQYHLAADPSVGLDRKTISTHLKRLRDAGLTYRPLGERKGEAITDEGRMRLKQVAQLPR